MDDSNVAIRLKVFIDSQGLSHSQFADECGIPRPSLSQILSGRNKKISDVIVGQIHKAYPELSVLWLLFGEGAMLVKGSAPAAVDARADADEDENIDYDHSGSEKAFAASGSIGEFAEIFGESASLFSFVNDEADSGNSPDANDAAKVAMPEVSKTDNPDVASKFADGRTDESLQANLRALKLRLSALKHMENELVEYKNKVSDLQTQIENLRKNPRKVSHITVYYDDSTFETFTPQQ